MDSKITTGSGASTSGFTMQGDINMGGYEVIGVTSFPSFNNSLTNKKYVDYKITSGLAGVSGGISQAQADARYVRKKKIALGEWMDTFGGINFVDYNWSKHVRKSIINLESNIEIKVASFVTDMSISQLNKHEGVDKLLCKCFNYLCVATWICEFSMFSEKRQNNGKHKY